VVPVQVGVIGRLTELVVIPAGQGRMRIVSPHGGAGLADSPSDTPAADDR
jgi:hypothetical protein